MLLEINEPNSSTLKSTRISTTRVAISKAARVVDINLTFTD